MLRQLEEIAAAKYAQPIILDPIALASEVSRYEYAMKIGQYSVLLDIRQAIKLIEAKETNGGGE